MKTMKNTLTTAEALNKVVNFFAVANLTLFATSIFHGLQIARSWAARADDIALGVLALVAVVWYLSGHNHYIRSALPLIFLFFALMVKVVGIYVTYNTFVLGGPDFAIAIFLALTTIIALWEYTTTGRLVKATTKPIPET